MPFFLGGGMNSQKVLLIRHQRGDTNIQKGNGQVQKSLCPQALMYNFIYKIQKRHLCTAIEHLAPAIQHSQKKERKILM